MKRVVSGSLALLSLGMIGYGCWLIYEPAGYIAVGAIIWADLLLASRREPPG